MKGQEIIIKLNNIKNGNEKLKSQGGLSRKSIYKSADNNCLNFYVRLFYNRAEVLHLASEHYQFCPPNNTANVGLSTVNNVVRVIY